MHVQLLTVDAMAKSILPVPKLYISAFSPSMFLKMRCRWAARAKSRRDAENRQFLFLVSFLNLTRPKPPEDRPAKIYSNNTFLFELHACIECPPDTQDLLRLSTTRGSYKKRGPSTTGSPASRPVARLDQLFARTVGNASQPASRCIVPEDAQLLKVKNR
jgi:hypothetical protein